MVRAAVLRRLNWRIADVVDVVRETPRASTVVLDVPEWPGHLAGQHLDVRLTAEDGYQAERSYSISSAPGEGRVTITVERLDDGEVSPYLTDELRAGDRLELRGPIGRWFVWDGGASPMLLVAGGSGVCPLMAMLRRRADLMSRTPARLLYSARDLEDVIFRNELVRLGAGDGVQVSLTLTRDRPPGWTGHARRVDERMLAAVAWPPDRAADTYVCGPTSFVETVAESLVSLGHDASRIRTERFGPTGG